MLFEDNYCKLVNVYFCVVRDFMIEYKINRYKWLLFWIKLIFLNEDEKSIVSVCLLFECVSRKIVIKIFR